MQYTPSIPFYQAPALFYFGHIRRRFGVLMRHLGGVCDLGSTAGLRPPHATPHVCELGPTNEPGCRRAICLLSHGSQETRWRFVSWRHGSLERRSGSLERWRRALSSPHSILQAQQTRSQSSSALLSHDDKHEHLHHLDRTKGGQAMASRPGRRNLRLKLSQQDQNTPAIYIR